MRPPKRPPPPLLRRLLPGLARAAAWGQVCFPRARVRAAGAAAPARLAALAGAGGGGGGGRLPPGPGHAGLHPGRRPHPPNLCSFYLAPWLSAGFKLVAARYSQPTRTLARCADTLCRPAPPCPAPPCPARRRRGLAAWKRKALRWRESRCPSRSLPHTWQEWLPSEAAQGPAAADGPATGSPCALTAWPNVEAKFFAPARGGVHPLLLSRHNLGM